MKEQGKDGFFPVNCTQKPEFSGGNSEAVIPKRRLATMFAASNLDVLRGVLLNVYHRNDTCMDCVNTFRGMKGGAPLFAKDAFKVCRALRDTGLDLDNLPLKIRERFGEYFHLIDESGPSFRKALLNNEYWSFCGCIYPRELLQVIEEMAQEQGIS